MADCEDRLAVDSSDESSDTVDVSSSEYSTSSDSESEEENLASQKTSCDDGERRKRAKRNAATAKTSQPRKKTKVSNTALDSKEMEDVAAWIFSSEEAKKVEQRIRSILLKEPRVNSQTDRKHFAEHLCAPPKSQTSNSWWRDFVADFLPWHRNPSRVISKTIGKRPRFLG